MSVPPSGDPQYGPYSGPPPTGPVGAGPYQPPTPYGPPPYGYGYGQPLPIPVLAARRPGPVTGAAVLGFIAAAFLLLASLFLVTGASVLDALDRGHSHELLADGLIDLALAALLIGGGVSLLSRSAVGRVLYSAGAAGVLIECVYWAVRWDALGQIVSVAFYIGVFALLAGVGALLVWLPDSSRWLTTDPAQGSGVTRG